MSAMKIARTLRDGAVVEVDRISGTVDGNLFAVLHIAGKGGCEIGLTRETACLRRLWVDPQFRRRSIGRVLLSLAREVAREHGKLALNWQVKKDNSAAILFYLKSGGQIVHDDGDGYYWMAYPLANPEEAS